VSGSRLCNGERRLRLLSGGYPARQAALGTDALQQRVVQPADEVSVLRVAA